MEKRKQPNYILTNPNSGRHLYGRGWLGLIPLVGAFVGVGLLTLGIVRYKDKKLALIGLACIFFTVIVYGSIYYYGEYSNEAKKTKIEFSQTELNRLVKDIEFYKTQYNSYPDSLEQLLSHNDLTFINDPISRSGEKFYYQKIGTGYKLFSSGLDRVPNIADDIYPTINTDSSKIGLIIK